MLARAVRGTGGSFKAWYDVASKGVATDDLAGISSQCARSDSGTCQLNNVYSVRRLVIILAEI